VHLNHRFAKSALAAIAPLALLGAVLVPGGVASAKAAKPNPINCTYSSITTTFNPALVAGGTQTSAGKSGTSTTTIQADYTCTGGVTYDAPTWTITSKSAKGNPKLYPTQTKGDYYIANCSTFASASTTKTIASALKSDPLQFEGGSISKGTASIVESTGNPTEEGFQIKGTVVGGTYPTAKNLAIIDAYLVGGTGTEGTANSNITGGCTSGPATNLYIDTTQSTATL
jgi:hypothetical protein